MVHNRRGRNGAPLDRLSPKEELLLSPVVIRLGGKAPAKRLEGAEGRTLLLFASSSPPDKRLCGRERGAEESEDPRYHAAIDEGLGSLAGMLIDDRYID
jgi:hypothetical protein